MNRRLILPVAGGGMFVIGLLFVLAETVFSPCPSLTYSPYSPCVKLIPVPFFFLMALGVILIAFYFGSGLQKIGLRRQ